MFLTVLCACVESWLGGDSSEGLEDAEDMLCNTLLITGPTGVGKTAAVYACAQELGFKVLVLMCNTFLFFRNFRGLVNLL